LRCSQGQLCPVAVFDKIDFRQRESIKNKNDLGCYISLAAWQGECPTSAVGRFDGDYIQSDGAACRKFGKPDFKFGMGGLFADMGEVEVDDLEKTRLDCGIDVL